MLVDLANEGISPVELLAHGRADLRGYGGDVREAVAVSAEPPGDGFVVRLEDGGQVTARRLLVTSGLLDELPEVPGVRERWGHGVLHRRYCHGWEVRDRRIGVLTPLAPPSEEDRRRLTALGVRTVEGVVSGLEGPGSRWAGRLRARGLGRGQRGRLGGRCRGPRRPARWPVPRSTPA